MDEELVCIYSNPKKQKAVEKAWSTAHQDKNKQGPFYEFFTKEIIKEAEKKFAALNEKCTDHYKTSLRTIALDITARMPEKSETQASAQSEDCCCWCWN